MAAAKLHERAERGPDGYGPMNFTARLRPYASMPPGVLLRKAWRRTRGYLGGRLEYLARERRGSYSNSRVEGPLILHLHAFPLKEARRQSDILAAACEHYLDHRFDLLGSGWVPVFRGMPCRGLEGYRYESQRHVLPTRGVNPSNSMESGRILGLIDSDYRPLDWQIDFKSGFRWREDTWHRHVPIAANGPGVDIKVPWELGRCQHLPQLALAHGLASAAVTGMRPAPVYRREFQNQVLDFLASNPPGYGVNWSCAMDVGIRIANWLLAYDLFAASGATFDPEFEALFKRGVLEHGRHIAHNLEWNEEFRSNHYLANIVGLLFAGGYLPPHPETDGWIVFSARELYYEIPAQFNRDGSNFEGSTSYHRLSTELAVFGVALLASIARLRLTLPSKDEPSLRIARGISPRQGGAMTGPATGEPDPFSPSILERLERAGEFTRDISKSDGRVAQVGDNDSGRLFKLEAAYRRIGTPEACARYSNLEGFAARSLHDDYLWEDGLDHRHLAGAVAGLIEREDLLAFAAPYRVDHAIVRSLRGGRHLPGIMTGSGQTRASTVRISQAGDFDSIAARVQSAARDRQIYRFERRVPASTDELALCAYPDFGLYLFKSAALFLSVRCGPHGQAGNGGHAHNDQLSVELIVDGNPIAVDPGTYLYTPLPERRNEYRSVSAHFAPRLTGEEPSKLTQLFSLPDASRARCLYFGPRGFIGVHHGFSQPVYRIIIVHPTAIEIEDLSEGRTLDRCRFTAGPASHARFDGPPYSPAYGIRENPRTGP